MDRSLANRIQAAHSALFADNNMDVIGEFFAPDYVAHVTGRDMNGGHDFIRKFLSMLHSSFPDLEVDVEILLEGEDRVAWQRTLKGTHEGAFMGLEGASLLPTRQVPDPDLAAIRADGQVLIT